MLRYEELRLWKRYVLSKTACRLKGPCKDGHEVVTPQDSREKWYYEKKAEFIATYAYPPDLEGIFVNGHMRQYFQYDEHPRPPAARGGAEPGQAQGQEEAAVVIAGPAAYAAPGDSTQGGGDGDGDNVAVRG